MAEREPGSQFAPGERIPYIICSGSDKGLAQRAEYLEYVREQHKEIDRRYYMNNMCTAVGRVLEPVLGGKHGVEALFSPAYHELVLKERKCSRSMAEVMGVHGKSPIPVAKRVKAPPVKRGASLLSMFK